MLIPDILKNSCECLGTIEPKHLHSPLTPQQIHESLLKTAIWPDSRNTPVFDIPKPGESVCLVVSDQTRQTGVDAILPIMVEEMTKNGCRMRDMFILFASGIHRHPTIEEQTSIIGPRMMKEFQERIFLHNPDSDLTMVGTTKRGNEVKINRRAVEADRLILFGSVIYHYHAGYGGGRKSLVPGLAGRDTIAHNHGLSLGSGENYFHPMAAAGILNKNPVAEEMLESARMCEPDAIINTVLDRKRNIIGVFSGDLDMTHRSACSLVDKTYKVNISRQADIVIASASSAPNWIQSHKALYNAHRAVKPDGKIILIAPCPEGLGDERFRHWIKSGDAKIIREKLKGSSEVLGQTALSTGIRGRQTILITNLSEKDKLDLNIETAPNLESAAERAVSHVKLNRKRKKEEKISYYIMPDAGYTVPFLL